MDYVLSRIGLRVPDVPASVEHSRAVLGLVPHDEDEDPVGLALPGSDEPCLVLIGDDAPALDHLLLLTDAATLLEVRSHAAAGGCVIDDPRALAGGEYADAIRLYAPNRLAVEIGVRAKEPMSAVPPVSREVGPVISGLDHVSLGAEDLAGTVAFFRDVLGFRLSDSVEDQRHWLRCGRNHHTIAVFAGRDSLHHYAFATGDIRQLQRLGDLLATRGQNFLWGPGRHGLGANVFSYHLDPAGAILEVCCDMLQVTDESSWDTRVWSADTLESALTWGPPPPAGFREFAIPTYDQGVVRR